jgi:predicted SnoaL-like aldol condensation-catalyzing enzyme
VRLFGLAVGQGGLCGFVAATSFSDGKIVEHWDIVAPAR